MVLVWAASPSRLSAYSFVIGIIVAAIEKGFSYLLFAWVLLLSSLKVMYLKWNCSLLFNFATKFFSGNCFSSLVEALGVCYFS